MSKLVVLVGGAYDEFDHDRRRTDRSMSLMIEEIDAINRNLEQLVAKRTSELRAREEDLQAQNMRFATAINNMTQGLLLFDSAQQLVVCNQRYIEMYGLSAEIVKPGCSFRDIIAHRKATGSFAGDEDEYCARILQSIELRNSMVVETRDGRSIQIVNEPLADGGWVATHEDITERRLAEDQITHLAHYDALTNLPNRALFHEKLKQELDRIAAGERLAVLYIDIDEFKSVNDTLGHLIGDELLKSVAASLSQCVAATDFVARLGGDEFAIVQTAVKASADVTDLVTRVFDAIREPYECLGHQVTTDASIGIALAPQHGVDLDQILKNADLAMYAAKSAGRRTYRFFEQEMDAQVKARRKLEMDLRQAITGGTLALKIVAALAASGLAANRLELEITEAVLIRDDEAALAILHQLRGIGVRIALDDFGTGYSSLSYLQRFPFDKIKIDRCFVNDIAEPDGSSCIVQAVVNIAAERHMTTTAEGVETRQQQELLRALGCSEMQGDLFSPPKSAAEINHLCFSLREPSATVDLRRARKRRQITP